MNTGGTTVSCRPIKYGFRLTAISRNGSIQATVDVDEWELVGFDGDIPLALLFQRAADPVLAVLDAERDQ